MMCLFSASYQISFCPLGSSFWPCLMYCRFHPCEEIAAAAAAASVLPPHPGLPPSSLFTRAGQPRKAWLDFREAQILQPRQSRLHRWVTIKHAMKLLLPLNFSGMRSTDIWDYVVLFLELFFMLVCYFWSRSCVHFSCKEAFSPSKRAINTHTCSQPHKQRCQRVQEISLGGW